MAEHTFSVGGLLRDGYDRLIRPSVLGDPHEILSLINANGSITNKKEASIRVRDSIQSIIKDIERFNHPTEYVQAIEDYIIVKYIDLPRQREYAKTNRDSNQLLQQDVIRLQDELKVLEQKVLSGTNRQLAVRNVEFMRENRTLKEQMSSFEQRLKQQQDELHDEKGQKAKLALEQNQRKVGTIEENKRRSDERRKDNERFNTKYLLMQRAVKDVESRQRKHEEKKKNRTILSKIKRVFTRKPVSKTPENFGKLEHRINEEVDALREKKYNAMQIRKKKYNANLEKFNEIRVEHKAPKKKNNRKVKTPQQPTLVRPQRNMSK